MAKTRMKDLLVVLPGIMGSVLEREGRTIWDPGLGMASKLFTKQQWLDDLVLQRDELTVASLDGVSATGLITSRTLVPGFKKIDGYSELRAKLHETFNLIEGDQAVDGVASNYFEFAYDWRRDNRVAAAQLKGVIDRELSKWQALAGDDARIVLVAHSMGGLVARYYLEVLGGWTTCRELISFGTPYRGALNALDFIANGYKKLFLEMSHVLRSFTAVYQLLPRYRAVIDSRTRSATPGWRYIHELVGVEFLDTARARTAYDDFHEKIATARDENATHPSYKNFSLRPLVGFGQKTNNSALLSNTGLEMSEALPDGVGSSWWGGDGTVAKVSAVPIEFGDGGPYRFINQQHATLQSDKVLLIEEIAQRLRTMQESTAAIRAGESGDSSTAEASNHLPSISLTVDDLYLPGEDVTVGVGLRGIDDPGPVAYRVLDAADRTVDEGEVGVDGSKFVIAHRLPGIYTIEVSTQKHVPGVGVVADLFEVT